MTASSSDARYAGLAFSADYWNENQPGFKFSTAPVGSEMFFAEVEAHRYTLEPHLKEVVGFDRWSGHDVLEVGCGIATDGIQFARGGARYVGVDQADAATGLAKRRFDEEGLDAAFMQGDATALPFGDETFDLVYANGVIHHIRETEVAVREVTRVLRPGGLALVMVYHRDSLNYRLNILSVRRVLAIALLSSHLTNVVAKITREDPSVLEGHRDLLRRHGLRYVRDRQLFLSNNTDGPGNPLSKVYSRTEGRALLEGAGLVDVRSAVRFLNLRVYPYGRQLSGARMARELERRIGWHLFVRGTKPSSRRRTPRTENVSGVA